MIDGIQTIEDKENRPIWIPYKDYLLQKEWLKSAEQEQIIRMGYFFWNNFSLKGYEEWKLKQENNGKK